MRSGGCEMALVCQRVVLQLRNPLRNGALAAKIGVLKLWGFRSPFCSCEMRWRGCEMTFVCQMVVSQRRAWGCEIISQRRAIFAAKPWFRRGHVRAAKSFRSRWPFSQGPILGCKISQTTEISCFWVPFGSLRPSFTSFTILPDFDHSKTYVTSKQSKIKALKSKLKQVIK